MRRLFPTLVLLAAVSAATACSAPADSAATAPPPASTPPPTPAPSAPGPTKIDMNAIFPPGPGRDLVLNNCQNCHTFVPIVVLQMDEAAWTRSSVDHRPRVTGLSEDDFKTLYDYLKANFNPAHPVPQLPRELLDTWTGN
jgi:cytochrome c5